MKCSGFKNRPGLCDLCGGSTDGDDRSIEDLTTGQHGNACPSCAKAKCWSRSEPCCRKSA